MSMHRGVMHPGGAGTVRQRPSNKLPQAQGRSIFTQMRGINLQTLDTAHPEEEEPQPESHGQALTQKSGGAGSVCMEKPAIETLTSVTG